MSEALLVGVDGGGTNCRVRVRGIDGSLVGEATGGTANVFAGLDAALAVIVATVERALEVGGLGPPDLARCHAGLGLAGANVPSVAEALHARHLPFAAFGLETDAVTACRGAFAGGEGGIAILGTGTAYCVRARGAQTLLGGWGMLVSDQGSGADLGRRALAQALLALDGARPRTPFCDAVLARFGGSAEAVVEFATGALPRDFGSLAPLVWDFAEGGDPVADRLVADSLADIEPMLRRMTALGAPALALLGGQAPRYRPRLAADLRAILVEPEGDAMEGGIDLARAIHRAAGGRA
ncbi:BadF/BadG/BcrA/BcrD ATPase family protein [Aureimonas sp. AU22]|uniref:BadF/BadG/BcrA/BcrD ATPase family protein n=1 Tax=Aureimonas sp. AU22 TaxID=1638162 RepID=UPI000781A10E|nr:BadF/BadG/BcrA/BcrD ATPase family protein [Aureimonas sp. AU22]